MPGCLSCHGHRVQPTEKLITNRWSEGVCVCAEEGVVCHLRVHASVYTLMILNVA